MSDRRSLDVIQVGKPCTADWDQMTGDSGTPLLLARNKDVDNRNRHARR